MNIQNLTSQDYWFGPLHLPANATITVDDTLGSSTSLYLSDDSVADAINYLYAQVPAKILVTNQSQPFPRPTGKPDVLHGDGSPEGLVYASEGTLYLRRDNANVYQKRSMVHVNTGWTMLGQGDRDQLKKIGLGYTGETFSKEMIAASFSSWVTGDCRATPLGLRAGDVMTNVILDITGTIQTVTKFQIGLYNSAGNTLLASTANSTSNQNSGLNSYALSAPYTVLADGLYYLAVIVAATTMGSIGATAFGQNKGQSIGSNPKGSIVLAGQTGLPAALGSSTWDQNIWFGWN